jgi:AraC family transcriptional activator of pobA
LFCTRGSGTHEVDFVQYPVKAGSVFLLSPGRTHKMNLSADIEGYVIMHTRDFYDQHYSQKSVRDYPFFCSNLNTFKIALNEEERNRTDTIFKEIISENKGDAIMKTHVLYSLIDLLYIYFSRLYMPDTACNQTTQNYLVQLMKFEDLLETNFKTMKSSSDYSAMMNMSAKHLNRICKICVNKTTSDIILDKIILEAKRMLAYGTHSIESVSGELGYYDQSYFTRIFKKKTGLTPLQFANTYRNS